MQFSLHDIMQKIHLSKRLPGCKNIFYWQAAGVNRKKYYFYFHILNDCGHLQVTVRYHRQGWIKIMGLGNKAMFGYRNSFFEYFSKYFTGTWIDSQMHSAAGETMMPFILLGKKWYMLEKWHTNCHLAGVFWRTLLTLKSCSSLMILGIAVKDHESHENIFSAVSL